MVDRRLFLCLAILALTLNRAAGAGSAAFGPIEIIAEREPQGSPAHGYTEYRFLVRNKGSEDRRVSLALPGEVFAGPGRSTGLTEVSRRDAIVGAGQSVVMSLLHPAQPAITGRGVVVWIDGRKQEDQVGLNPTAPRGVHPGYYGGRRGRGVFYSSGMGMSNEPLVLLSQRVREDFFRRTLAPAAPGPGGPAGRLGGPAPGGIGLPAPGGGPVGPGGFGGGMAGGGMAGGGMGRAGVAVVSLVPGQHTRSDTPVSLWSQNWLAYTRYDGLVLTREDVHELDHGGNEAKSILQAIWQYVEAGGSLLVLGPGSVEVPPSWRRGAVSKGGLALYQVGFGQCLISSDRDAEKWPEDRWSAIGAAWSTSAAPFLSSRSLVDLNNLFPVVDDLGIPVVGLFALMLLFSVAIGPVNLIVLARTKRRIWMLWTVPALSAATCLAVFTYMVIAEGWQGHAHVSGITLLDEPAGRATTIGRSAFYSPLTPGDGLRFATETEVQIQGGEHPAYSSSCAISWTSGQHLTRGWVSARVPAHFTMRKSESRRERLKADRQPDGSLVVRNYLGVDVGELWLSDEKGQMYHGGPIPASGQATTLQRTGKEVRSWPGEIWRRTYSGTDWTAAINQMAKNPLDYLGPQSYLAVIDSTPFLEQALNGARTRDSKSIVVGLLTEVSKTK